VEGRCCGGGDDVALGAKIAYTSGCVNLSGFCSLSESAAVVAGSVLLVAGDSGILHVGVGCGVSTVSLFGPGIAEKWAPRGDRHIVLDHRLPCSPCTRFGYTPKCRDKGRCISEITVDEVYDAATTLLSSQGKVT